MKNIKLILLGLLGLLYCSCDREDFSQINEGTIEIVNISLQEYVTGGVNSRVMNSAWEHVFKNELVLEILSKNTGISYQLKFNPNELTTSPTITLPYGDYTYRLQNNAQNIELFLPIEAAGEFRLNAATVQLTLAATTTYGLVTVEKANLKTTPVLIMDQVSTSLMLRGDFYYAYVKENLLPTLEVVEDVFGNTIRRNLTIQSYKHYSFIVKISDGTGKVIEIMLKAFDLVEEDLLVNMGIVPGSYSPSFLTNLSFSILETSGLAYVDGGLWTHNDSGNSNELFQFSNSDGGVLKTVTISNALNVDWEAMTQSGTHLFVGDFGNNSGNRTDLTILKVAKSQMLAASEVIAEKITFTYEDQSDFSAAPNANNFDCEAFFFANDSLYLFSKNWLDNQAKVYVLPSSAGNYEADLKTTFDTQGLITGSSINSSTGDIVLLGYTNEQANSESFVWLLSGYTGSNFFGAKKSRINLGSVLNLGQTEAVFLSNDNTGWITSESIQLLGLPAKLYSFDFKNFF